MSTKNLNAPYPGNWTTADGSAAVVWVEQHISDGACAYPITPSTNMGSGYQLAVANGLKNLWGEELFFLETESEHSAGAFPHGLSPPPRGRRAVGRGPVTGKRGVQILRTHGVFDR